MVLIIHLTIIDIVVGDILPFYNSSSKFVELVLEFLNISFAMPLTFDVVKFFSSVMLSSLLLSNFVGSPGRNLISARSAEV